MTRRGCRRESSARPAPKRSNRWADLKGELNQDDVLSVHLGGSMNPLVVSPVTLWLQTKSMRRADADTIDGRKADLCASPREAETRRMSSVTLAAVVDGTVAKIGC